LIRFPRKEIEFTPGDSILQSLLNAEVEIAHSCGGMGTCGTCRVNVCEAPLALESPNEVESDLRKTKSFLDKERLSCQTKPTENLIIEIPSPDKI